MKGVETKSLDTDFTKTLNIAIVHARWNKVVTDALVESAVKILNKHECAVVDIYDVPGSYELPYACQRLAQLPASTTSNKHWNVVTGNTERNARCNNKKYDAIIAIGVLIKGETMHFEYIAEAVTQGLCRVQLDTGVPVVFGVLTCLTEEQALKRAGLMGSGHCHGEDWAYAAMEMSKYGRMPQLQPLQQPILTEQ